LKESTRKSKVFGALSLTLFAVISVVYYVASSTKSSMVLHNIELDKETTETAFPRYCRIPFTDYTYGYKYGVGSGKAKKITCFRTKDGAAQYCTKNGECTKEKSQKWVRLCGSWLTDYFTGVICPPLSEDGNCGKDFGGTMSTEKGMSCSPSENCEKTAEARNTRQEAFGQCSLRYCAKPCCHGVPENPATEAIPQSEQPTLEDSPIVSILELFDKDKANYLEKYEIKKVFIEYTLSDCTSPTDVEV